MEREQLGALAPHRDGAGPEARGTPGAEPSLGELFKRLTTDTSELVRQELSLARAEVREAGSAVARDGTKIGIGAGLALCGALALTAFLVIALGDLLNNYWLGALVVGLALLAVGGVLARNAVADVKRRAVPEHTLGSLREDAAWAKQEVREVKRELTR
jgi:uncharacterized membrane protein YqjE